MTSRKRWATVARGMRSSPGFAVPGMEKISGSSSRTHAHGAAADEREGSGDLPQHSVTGQLRASRLESQHRPPRVNRPAGGLVTAGDALQVNAVLLEMTVALVSPKSAHNPFQRHHKYLPVKTQATPLAVLSMGSTT
jgi:hypothetical protein